MNRLRIYVAGPYCPRGVTEHDCSRIAQYNVDKAIEIANAIMDKGHYVHVPHLTHYMHIHYSCKKDRYNWYYEYDNSFLLIWANALYFIGHSKGATAELELAESVGYPIFTALHQIPEYVRT